MAIRAASVCAVGVVAFGACTMKMKSPSRSVERPSKPQNIRFAAVLSLLLLFGCGYRFTAGGAPLPEGVRSVHVPVFTNRTSESGIEAIFTEQLRERCMRAGVLGGDASDARIEGEVRGVFGAPTILSNQGRLASYRMYGNANLRLVKGGRVLREVDVSAQEDYLPDRTAGIEGDVLRTETNRSAAVRRLAEALMRDGYDRLTTGW